VPQQLAIPSRFVLRHTGRRGRFFQLRIERCQRQAEANSQLQVGGIINRKIVNPCQWQRVRPDPEGRFVIHRDRQGLQQDEELGDLRFRDPAAPLCEGKRGRISNNNIQDICII